MVSPLERWHMQLSWPGRMTLKEREYTRHSSCIGSQLQSSMFSCLLYLLYMVNADSSFLMLCIRCGYNVFIHKCQWTCKLYAFLNTHHVLEPRKDTVVMKCSCCCWCSYRPHNTCRHVSRPRTLHLVQDQTPIQCNANRNEANSLKIWASAKRDVSNRCLCSAPLLDHTLQRSQVQTSTRSNIQPQKNARAHTGS